MKNFCESSSGKVSAATNLVNRGQEVIRRFSDQHPVRLRVLGLYLLAEDLFLGYIRNVVSYALPASGDLDPGVRPSELATDLLALHHPLLSSEASDHRRVSINADLHITRYA